MTDFDVNHQWKWRSDLNELKKLISELKYVVILSDFTALVQIHDSTLRTLNHTVYVDNRSSGWTRESLYRYQTPGSQHGSSIGSNQGFGKRT